MLHARITRFDVMAISTFLKFRVKIKHALGVLGVTHTTHESCQHASQKKKKKKSVVFNRPPVKQHLVIE